MTTAAGDDGRAPPTILVVDDEKNIRRTLQLVLHGEGYDVRRGRRRRAGARDPRERASGPSTSPSSTSSSRA